MRLRGTAVLALAAGLVGGGCGGGDDDRGGAQEAKSPPAVRCTPAPAGSKPVLVKARWKRGEKRRVTIEKSREEGGREGRAVIPGSLTVMTAGRGGASLRLTMSEPVALFVAGQEALGALNELADALEPVTIDYSAAADGTFGEVRNLPSLRDQFERSMDVIEREGGTGGVPPEQSQAVRQLLTSDDFIQAAAITEPSLLHNPYGIEFEPGEAFTAPYELANPFGGEPILGSATFELARAPDRNGCLKIDAEIRPDPEELRRVLVEAVGRLAPPDQQPNVRELLDEARVSQELSFAYDRASGWIVRGEMTREISVADRSRTERTVVTNAPG